MTCKKTRQIDAILPQTQCQLCQYPGCLPYAQAIVNHQAPIDRCLPGGTEALKNIAEIMEQDPQSMLASMQAKAKAPGVARINADACIGCKKCVDICPTNAIFGAPKTNHAVIASDCTGCDRCLDTCPVDCIDILPSDQPTPAMREYFKQRYIEKNDRIAIRRHKHADQYQQHKATSHERNTHERIIKRALKHARQKPQKMVFSYE